MNYKKQGRLVVFFLITCVLLVLLPFLSSFFYLDLSWLTNNSTGFRKTLINTLFYGGVGAVVLVMFGFTSALLMRSITFSSKLGKTLSILILPMTIGNVSVAFVTKLLLGETITFSYFAESGFFPKAVFISAIHIFQYGLLFAYLFWMALLDIPTEVTDYAKAQKFSSWQSLKDIYFPKTKNLSTILLILGFTMTVFDDSKITYLFKASEGTGTEMITNWLARNYRSALLEGSKNAERVVMTTGASIFLSALAALAGLLLILQTITLINSRTSAFFLSTTNRQIISKKAVANTVAFFLIGIAIIPLVFAALKLDYNIPDNLNELGFSTLMTLIASIASSALAIFFSIFARLGWSNMLASFSTRSIWFFIALFLLMLVPPIIILICGYKWMALAGYRDDMMIYLFWTLGHMINTLPLLGSFLIFTHFRLKTSELEYLKVHRLKLREIISLSFFNRFKAEYFLLFLISFSTIWNEGVVNTLFSDYVPSFASKLKMLILGSGSNYAQGIGYLAIALTISCLATLLWRLIIEKGRKLQSFYEND